TIGVSCAAAVAHESPRGGELAALIDRGHPIARCQSSELPAPSREQDVHADHESAEPPFSDGCKDLFEIGFVGGIKDVEFEPERAGGRLRVTYTDLGDNRIGWVD